MSPKMKRRKMGTENQGLQNSLRCLQHPLSLISIVVLLINDHIWKISNPSWLTGKISDFAGLFFFPFIIIAVMSLLFENSNFSCLHVGQMAFVSIGIWFFLAKTYFPVNEVTKTVISFLVGHPTQFTLDWTDSFALLVLWPSWSLWSRSTNTRLHGIAYISLVAGALACLATSPVPPPTVITSLKYEKGDVYAVDKVSSHAVFKSLDGGATWEYCPPDCGDIWNSVSVREMPIQVCDPEETSSCYRITGSDSIEMSKDNGKSWSIGWEIPPDRREFVEREGSIPTPKDMIIVSDVDRYLLVAMGDDGIIRRYLPAGEWERIAVYDAQPIPYFATDFGEALTFVWRELAIWVAMATIALVIAGLLISRIFPTQNIGALDYSDWALLTIVLVPISIGLMILVLILLTIIISILDGLFGLWVWISNPVLLILMLYACLLLLFRSRIQKWVNKLVQEAGIQSRLTTISLSMVMGVSLVGASPWPLWALGFISRYQTAQIVAIVISMLIIAIGYFLIYKAKSLSPKGNTNLPTID
ncbi:MAG: hypothetical protein HY258_02890 [Chloroflexi bacterium]|nr:hypothetical protein [Chloroflexota bacterium]